MNFQELDDVSFGTQDSPPLAFTWPLHAVRFSVENEARMLGKGLPTLATLVRPFSSVNYLVLNKARLLNKGFPTLPTFIRL